MNVRALVAELVGAFVLVFFGSLGIASSYIIGGQNSYILFVELVVPFAFGLGLLAAIAIGGHASGGHFNPAVTLAALFDGRLDWMNALGYVVAQVIGAIAGSLALLLVLTADVVKVTTTHPGALAEDAAATQFKAFAIEIILTAVFVAVILTVTRKLPNAAIFVIPLTLTAIHFIGIPLSGASVNPARSLAPAVVSGTYDDLWIYLTAPFAGSIIGWAIARFLTPPEEDLEVEVEIDEDEAELEELDFEEETGRE